MAVITHLVACRAPAPHAAWHSESESSYLEFNPAKQDCM
jgi:hypothetical protein